MKVKLRTGVYIPTSIKSFTCKDCVFLYSNGVICKAPDSIYTSCFNCHQLFLRSQKCFKIFDL